MSDEKKKSWLRGAVDKVQAQVDNQKAQQAEGAADAGSLAIEKQFGLSRVAMYDGGFVRVGRGGLNMLTALSSYERLKSIKYAEQVQDRSAVGHALYGGGKLGSRQRRTLSLTIATDRKIHILSTEAEWLSNDDKAGRALEAAGQAILDTVRDATPLQVSVVNPPPPAPASTEVDIADQIKKLADLHAAGILTDQEFAAKKADLLDRL